MVEALACVPRLHWIDARYLGSLDSWYYIIGYVFSRCGGFVSILHHQIFPSSNPIKFTQIFFGKDGKTTQKQQTKHNANGGWMFGWWQLTHFCFILFTPKIWGNDNVPNLTVAHIFSDGLVVHQPPTIVVILSTRNPNDPCFYWKRPCFGGLKPKNKGQTGSRSDSGTT